MTSNEQLQQGSTFVTGAGSGIGAALATHAALSLQMPVAVTDASGERAESTTATIREQGGRALAIAVDVTDYDAVAAAAAEATNQLGPATLIGANAGIEHAGSMWTTEARQWEHVQSVNVNGVFNTVRALLPNMIDSGRRGHVLCVSSVGGLAFSASMSAYLVSKHAVRVLAQCLAEDLAQASADIGVSILLPGAVRTRIFDDAESSPGSEAASAYRATMADNLAKDGMEPAALARLTFEAIAAGRSWIYPHPEAARDAGERMIGSIQEGLAALS